MCTCDFGGGPTFRGPNKGGGQFSYTSLCKSCYFISVAKYHRDPIMVLYWRPHSQVVHVPVWSSQNARGPKGGIVEKFTPPSPLKIGSGKLVLDKKFPPDKLNALEWSKRMYEEVSLLAVPFRSKHFDAFWHFLSFLVIIHILWVQQIWLAKACFTFKLNMLGYDLESSPQGFLYCCLRFCVSFTVFNNSPLKFWKNIHSGFTLVRIPNNSAWYVGLWLKLL